MRLAHVDKQEFDVFLVLLRHGVEGPNLGPEGRSSVAPKDKRHGLLVAKSGEADFPFGLHAAEIEIRSKVTGHQLPFPVAHLLHDGFGLGAAGPFRFLSGQNNRAED